MLQKYPQRNITNNHLMALSIQYCFKRNYHLYYKRIRLEIIIIIISGFSTKRVFVHILIGQTLFRRWERQSHYNCTWNNEYRALRAQGTGSVHIWVARQTLGTSIFATKPATARHIGRALAPNQRHSAAPREKTSVCSHKEWVQICTKTIVYVAISPAPSPLPPRSIVAAPIYLQ